MASGSTITLRCVILSPYQTRPIRGVQWLRDNKLLTFQVTHSSTSSRETRGTLMKFFTPSPPPSSACPPTLENLPNERNTIINHRCRCRDDNRSSYSIPSPLLSNTFLRAYRISLSALWRGVNEKSRYQKKCRYLNKNKRKRKEKNRTFSPWKIE